MLTTSQPVSQFFLFTFLFVHKIRTQEKKEKVNTTAGLPPSLIEILLIIIINKYYFKLISKCLPAGLQELLICRYDVLQQKKKECICTCIILRDT